MVADAADLVEVRGVVAGLGTHALPVDDLTAADLPGLAWSGDRPHLEAVARLLERVEGGEVEYLAVRAPGGSPVAKGAIDYARHPGAGTLRQLVAAPELRGLGVGARLIAEAERRIRRRGLDRAIVGVEASKPRLRAVYERLGYAVCGSELSSWEQEDAAGNRVTRHAEITLLDKRLEPLLAVPRGVVVLVGAPGAGKTTLAAQLVRLGTVAPADVCEGDDGERDRRLRERLALGHAALADSTNVRRESRAALVELAREAGVPASALRLPVPLAHRERGGEIEPLQALMEEGFAAVHDVPGAAAGVTAAAAALRIEVV